MTPEKRKKLQPLVQSIVKKELRLVEQVLTKRAMMILEYADEVQHDNKNQKEKP